MKAGAAHDKIILNNERIIGYRELPRDMIDVYAVMIIPFTSGKKQDSPE
jgi:hypothetical protein